MLNGSYTLQQMLNSVSPTATGNFNPGAVPYYPAQFQSPYPTPMDLSMRERIASQYQSLYQTPQQDPTMPPGISPNNPFFQHRRHQYYPQQEQPSSQRYVTIPGAPVNPDLAHEMANAVPVNNVVPPPGRTIDIADAIPGYREALQERTKRIANGEHIYYDYPKAVQEMIQQQQIQQAQQARQTYGVVDYYYGEPVHPHVNEGWYGSSTHPFVRTVGADPIRGYNPYGRPALTREEQDTANLAAYYGMSYEEFLKQGSEAWKMMSRCVNRGKGLSEEEVERRAHIWDVKLPTRDGIPDNDEELFYPRGAFGYDGQLTHQYQQMFCISDGTRKILNRLKVSIKIEETDENGNKKVTYKNMPKRKMDHLRMRERVDSIIKGAAINKQREEMRMQYLAYLYNQAPERRLDKMEGTVFDVTCKSLALAWQREMKAKLESQKRTRSATLFNHAAFRDGLEQIWIQAKAGREERNRRKWNELIDRVVPDERVEEVRKEMENQSYLQLPYITDGDWVIAKPGKDIVGLPLEKSVNKIIRMNLVTGEEEIYQPGKALPLNIQSQINSAMAHPNFNEIDDEEEKRRLELFKNAGWKT